MADYPQIARGDRTGPRARNAALLEDHVARLAEHEGARKRQARAFQRVCRKLMTKADLRVAAGISDQVKTEWREASVRVGGKATRLEALKVTARRKLDRMLSRALPNYRQLRALQRAHFADAHRLTARAMIHAGDGRVHVDFGDVAPSDRSDPQDYSDPYNSWDIHSVDPDNLISSNLSYVRPISGQLVNDVVFDHDDDTAVIVGLFGLHYGVPAASRVSCGVAYTLPREGRLQVTGVLQNRYNHVTMNVRDNFGFSHANLSVRISLFVTIVRGTLITHMPTTILTSRLTSNGSNESMVMPDVDTVHPYTVHATTTELLPGGASVQVLVGSEVLVESDLDDMRSHVRALLWWHLKRMSVAVV